jgi:hypothetical protein
MRLIINGYDIELPVGVTIAQTKQVNDLVSLSSRQSNYTNTFNIPKTAKNIRTMQFLGMVGNNSNVPYQRNECYLYDDEGLCFVNKGWAIITETNNFYKCNVYDGIIDFYKSIENKNLSELDLTEINHVKNLTTIVNSWQESSPYRYIIADYNGKAIVGGNTHHINADYLVPSVNVKWLFNKVHEYFGFNYTGNFLNLFNFDNFWMTFPKGVNDSGTETDYYNSEDLSFESTLFSGQKQLYIYQNSNTLNNFFQITNSRHFKVNQSGTFKIKISGEILPSFSTNFISMPECEIWLGLNSENISDANNVIPLIPIKQGIQGIQFDENSYVDVTSEVLINLQNLDSLCLILITNQNISPRRNVRFVYEKPDNQFKLEVIQVAGADIDFNLSFIDFKVKDFINEIIWRFALTPYYDVSTNTITYKQLSEILQNSNIDNWTNKYDSVNNESYVYGSYAKENILTSKYNDENSDYYDGKIQVFNENLEDNKTIISSKIYAPEKDISIIFEKPTNVYKLWSKEVKDNGDVTYKSLDKRFYFLRSDNYIFTHTTQLKSEVLSDLVNITSAPFESYYSLPFQNIVQNYYSEIRQILNNSKLINSNIFLNNEDVANVDFSKLKYIEQLGSYFLLNKITNFTKKGLTKCELIKVDYVAVPEIDDSYPYVFSLVGGCFNINPFVFDIDNLIYIQISDDNGLTWSTNSTPITSVPSCGYVNVTGLQLLMRLVNVTGVQISNIIIVPA